MPKQQKNNIRKWGKSCGCQSVIEHRNDEIELYGYYSDHSERACNRHCAQNTYNDANDSGVVLYVSKGICDEDNACYS